MQPGFSAAAADVRARGQSRGERRTDSYPRGGAGYG
jgi:hypothetical protein